MYRRVLPLVLLVGCSAASDRSDDRVIRVLDPPIVVGELFASRPAEEDAGHYTLYRPTDLRVHGDTVVLLDTGNDRVITFDPELRPIAEFGRSGAGPGEFQVPFYAQVWNDQYVIGELSTQRISFFTLEGEFIRSVRLPGSLGSFALGDDGTIYLASPEPNHYLLTISPDGAIRPFARRPDGIYTPEDMDDLGRPRSAGRELVAVTDGAIHVVENHLGLLLQYDTLGELRHWRELPREIIESLRNQRDEIVGGLAKQGIRVVSAALLKGLTVNPDGSLFLLFGADDVAGAVLDPVDYTARLIRMPQYPIYERLVLRASAAVIQGDTLYAIADHGLHAFRLVVP